jgi:hypothetical protein
MLPWIITYSWTFWKIYVVHHFVFCNDIFCLRYNISWETWIIFPACPWISNVLICHVFFFFSMIWGERLLFILLMYWYNFCPSLFKLYFHITNMTISSMFYKLVHVVVNFVFKFVLFLQEFPSSSDFKSSLWILFLKV